MKEKQVFKIPIRSHDCKNYKRLDHFLAHQLPDYSRSFIQNIFKQGLITADSEELELNKMPARECLVKVSLLASPLSSLTAEDIPLDILYEDDYLLFVNKPAGLTVHPAPGHRSGTLVHALLNYMPFIETVGHPLRPGIVHRLDKGTSGVMAVAKENRTHAKLSSLFSTHSIDRQYECLVRGRPPFLQGTLNSTIGRHPFKRQKMAVNVKQGKQAVTHYKAVGHFGSFSHLSITLETGRTHQIRVHLSSLLKTPILNDALYGNPPQDKNFLGEKVASIVGTYPHPFLHAQSLGLIHPITNKPLFCKIGPPDIFQQVSQGIGKE